MTGEILAGGTLVAQLAIGDFESPLFGANTAQDRLVFATGLESGNFNYSGGGAFTAGGQSEARFGGNQIERDLNGNGSADPAFSLLGMTQANQLTTSDFLFLS